MSSESSNSLSFEKKTFTFVDTIGMGDSLGWYQKTRTIEVGTEDLEIEDKQKKNDKKESCGKISF